MATKKAAPADYRTACLRYGAENLRDFLVEMHGLRSNSGNAFFPGTLNSFK